MNPSLLLLFLLLLALAHCQVVNYLSHPQYECIKCLCHARTGCYRRQNCAQYSISLDYWKTAGSPAVDADEYGDPTDQQTYTKCLSDENCIVATIVNYFEAVGPRDCNCDGKIDCKDRFAVHLFGGECFNPKFNKTYARRFNECRNKVGVDEMLPEERGAASCEPESV